jgi:hypothetical protein
MKLNLKNILQLMLLAAVLVTAGCTPAATPTPVPTEDAMAIASTVSAIQTEAVMSVMQTMTQEAFLNPSATPTQVPTNTPEPTATATSTALPTAIPVLPTRTVVVATLTPTQTAYQCSITSLDPASGRKMNSGEDFDFKVTLKNIGTKTWESSDIDFAYQSGAKFQKRVDVLDLPSNVDPGKEVTFIVDMLANTGTGTQTATWVLKGGSSTFCTVTISVNVQ